MARTESAMIALGTVAPGFELVEVTTGARLTRDHVRGERGLLAMFICRHCPFVKHVEKELSALGNEYLRRGVGVVAISSNDAANHPDDAPASLKEQAALAGFAFPCLYDETQAVAHAYDATCTPDFFLFDKDLKLVYRGQLDESRPGNGIPVTGQDLRSALDTLLAGHAIDERQRPSIGCNIKWKKS